MTSCKTSRRPLNVPEAGDRHAHPLAVALLQPKGATPMPPSHLLYPTLTAPITQISPIVQIIPKQPRIIQTTLHTHLHFQVTVLDVRGDETEFDHLVLATHTDVSLEILGDQVRFPLYAKSILFDAEKSIFHLLN